MRRARASAGAGVGPGSRVAVVGAGSMGLLEIGAALAAGAAAVVAVEPRDDRRALAARAAGAVAALPDADPAGVADALGGLADQVFVCTSAGGPSPGRSTWPAPGGRRPALRAAAARGRRCRSTSAPSSSAR